MRNEGSVMRAGDKGSGKTSWGQDPYQAASCRIESAGNVVKIRVQPQVEPKSGQFRTAVRIVCDREDTPGDKTYQSGQASPADSGTCSDLDAGSPPRPSDDEISCDSLNSSEPDGYEFHLNELSPSPDAGHIISRDAFAGRKYLDGEPPSRPITSANGTVRGVRNRVRAGIATFLHINTTKSWQEKEVGQVVVYTTTMGIVRATSQRCLKVRHILRTNLIKYIEKDVFMSREVQAEIRERMGQQDVKLPQVFVEGQYIGDADTIEKLNESGQLRNLLKPYKCLEAWTTCEVCGGYRLLPCALCNGSKKSVHRNHFTTQLVALKCMNCDEVGLVKCYNC